MIENGNGSKKPLVSKTVIFFGLYLVINIAALFGYADFVPGGDQAEIVGIVVATVGLILRFVTKQPISL